ncbi:MAG: hypothetical protein V4596_08095 [Bdellovibrionota bacterium]
MKLFIIAVAISLMSSLSFAQRTSGGDMPFPIGKVIDFPKDDGKGVWKDELKKKIFRLRPLKGVLEDGTILVQMLGLNKKVIADGLGVVGSDKVLTANLRYIADPTNYVEIKIANLCSDALFDNSTDFSELCKTQQMWASVRVLDSNDKLSPPQPFVIKKTRER